jgi:hypothetical protein
MRLLRCAAALATATLFASSLATPTPNTRDPRGDTLADRIENRKDKKKPDTKYFHEPG